ncbi:MAG: Alkyl hydroperoxide reductase subunit C-like protein [Ignavibacteriae bacterium]|nr:MAG: Alkyl hydroperoxide reductase subunit C-like protein [Ignavibacteriota bacterium]
MNIQLNNKAINFKLFNTERQEVSLNDFIGKKLVLAFFPGAFTGVCTKELCTMRDMMSEFNSLNAQVVAISVDSPFANKAFAIQNQLTFPILSDYTRDVAKTYCGLHEDFAGLKGYTASKRAVFVLDQNQIVKYIWISEDPGKEPPYDEIRKVISEI